MFCPNCGANNSTEQKFCRSCGLNLEKTAESMLEQLPTAQSASLLKHEKLIERFGNFALGGFGVVILLAVTAILYTLVQKFIVTGTNVFFGVLMIAFFVFAFLSLIFVIFNESLKEKKVKMNPALEKEMTENKETGKLLEEGSFEPVPSITENSTELLKVKSRRTTSDL